MFDSPGVIRLTNSNTYTGGTEVVAGTIALSRADSAGSGAILLDGGTLRFENSEPIVFLNDVGGRGSIVFAGTAPVTLASKAFDALPFKTFTKGTTIDFPDFADCTLNIAVEGGVDLGGRAVSVAGVSGSGRIANGTMSVSGEINPGGVGSVGTLVFETAPVVDGATLVCEVSGESADKLVVEDDFAISALAFTARRLAGYRSTSAVVLETTGALSGTFASTSLPRGDYTVGYSDGKAVLNHNCGIIIIFQ